MTHASRPWLEGVEGDDAREFIGSNEPVIRVVAGPGSGKTFCLERRTWRLVEGDGINQRKIFVGTFTRAMADELGKKLGRFDDIKISTLHSLAYKLLRDNPSACQGMKLRFLLKSERRVMLHDIKSDVSLPSVNDCEKELRKMEASLAQHPDRAAYDNERFAGAVERWLERHQAMLIGYVVSLCVSGLESDDIRCGMFDHVVIDEYQDLTDAEQELVGLLWSRNGSLAVMGDDNQSIYGFRHNHPEGVSDFHEMWKDLGYDCQNFTFPENRRCGDRIVGAANRMLERAGRGPQMCPKSGRQGKLDLIYWDSLEQEIERLAAYIKSHPTTEKFLVLVPLRLIGYRLAREIGDRARTMFTEEVLEHPIAQEVFTAASLLADPNDWVAARVWLGFKHGEPEHDSSRNRAAYANLLRDVSPAVGGHELLRKIVADDEGVKVSGRGSKNVGIRAQKAIKLIDRDLEPREVVNYLFDPARAECEADDDKRLQLADSLQKLRTAAHALLENEDNLELRQVLDNLRYKIATRAPLISDAEDPLVKITTLHSAKGLEEDNVVTVGVPDQLMPGRPKDDEDPAEKGRLFYVAVTRAKESLIVSWPQSIPANLMEQNGGRIDRYTFHNGVRCAKTSRSRLLTRIGSSTRGADWLSRYIDPDIGPAAF